MTSFIEIDEYNLTLTASYMNVEIFDFKFGSHITLKISFFDIDSKFLLHKFVVLEGQNYIDMTTSGSSDIFIRSYVETALGLTFKTGPTGETGPTGI
jgi:hypothetical protein